jgi:hypothetical protein
MSKHACLLVIAALLVGCSPGQSRPSNLPTDATWLGGPDGGVWLACVQLNPSRLRCSVFQENGDLLQSGTYSAKSTVSVTDLVAFDGNTLLTRTEALVHQ